MDFSKILAEIEAEIRPFFGMGRVANYIPALASVDPNKFGMALVTLDRQYYEIGDSREKFSIQSISKVYSLCMALIREDHALWKRVGLEPSGNPFNSLIQLEYEKGIPRNPFINAGALVVIDVLLDHLKNPKTEILNFVRLLGGSDDIYYDYSVADSERETGFTNAALVNFMRSHKNINHPIEQILDIYFHQCSIAMSCAELAHSLLFLANHGLMPGTGKRITAANQAKRINAIMLTCGFYDEAGEFAYRVGMPGKSGVGGGIVGVIPNKLAIAVWSPELNDHGNSVLGIKALELFTTKTGLSIF